MRQPHRIHHRRSRRPLFDALESRQHMAADLIVTSTTLFGGKVDPVPAAGDFKIDVMVKNIGNSAAPDAMINIYQSDTPTPAPGDPIIATADFGNLNANGIAGRSISVHVNRADWDLDDNAGFVTVMIDPYGWSTESNESNNSGRGVGLDSLQFLVDGDVEAYTGLRPQALPASGIVNSQLGDELIGDRDIDAWAIDCTAGKFYEADIDTASGGPDTAVRIYDHNMNLVASNDDGGYSGAGRTIDPYVQWSANLTGRYFVVVSAKENANADPTKLTGRVAGATGNYTLVARQAKWSTVSITSSGTATEGATSASITVTRSSDGWIDRPLDVRWETYGSAAIPNDIDLPTTGVVIPAGQTSVTIYGNPHADGVEEGLEYRVFNLLSDPRYYRDGASSTAAVYIQDNPAEITPKVADAHYACDGGQTETWPGEIVNFTQAIPFVHTEKMWLENLTTHTQMDVTTYSQWMHVDTSYAFVFRVNNTNTIVLPDGSYRLHFGAGSVENSTHVANKEMSVDFSVLAGDANQDGKVDFSDLLILARNYGSTGKTFSQGNFDYSNPSNVDFNDLLILARNYGKSIAPPASAAPVAAVDSDVPARRTRSTFGILER